MSSNQIANFVSAISNIRNSLKYSFSWPRTKTILEILKILKKEGYIAHYQTSKRKDKDFFEIFLKRGDPFGKYYHFKIISKPSFKRHFSKKEVWKFSNNMPLLVVIS